MRTWSEYKKTMRSEDQIFEAAREGDLGYVQGYLAQGAAIEIKNHKGYTPLMLACYYGHAEICRALIVQGADVNSVDHGGNTILMGVAFKGFREIAALLLSAGADPRFQNVNGMTALDFARAFGRHEIVDLLDADDATMTQRISLFLKMIT